MGERVTEGGFWDKGDGAGPGRPDSMDALRLFALDVLGKDKVGSDEMDAIDEKIRRNFSDGAGSQGSSVDGLKVKVGDDVGIAASRAMYDGAALGRAGASPLTEPYRDLVHGDIIQGDDEVWAYGEGPWTQIRKIWQPDIGREWTERKYAMRRPLAPKAESSTPRGEAEGPIPSPSSPPPLVLVEAARRALGEMQWMITAVAMSRNTHEDPAILEAERVYSDLERALSSLPVPSQASTAPPSRPQGGRGEG